MGYIIAALTVIAMHVILIIINMRHIVHIWRTQQTQPFSSLVMEMEDFVSRFCGLMPGIL